MKKRTYWIGFILIVLGGLIVRLVSLPPSGFFDDVPGGILGIGNKVYAFGFPGYAPYYYLVAWLAGSHISCFQAMVVLSVAMAMASVVYVMLAARAAGDLISWAAGVTISFGIIPVYFSLAGTTYTSDMLCVAAMIYHGWEFVRSRRSGHFYGTLGWFCLGVLMRPVSIGFTGLGLVALLYFWGNRRAAIITITAIGLAFTLFVVISSVAPYYGSFAGFVRAGEIYRTVLHHTADRRHIATNLFRFFFSPVYAEQIWLVFGLGVAVKCWKNRNRQEFIFLLALLGPYLCVILRYMAHAGYYCLIVPGFALLPVCFALLASRLSARLVGGVAVVFMVVALGQWFLVRPIQVTGIRSAVIDAYFLQYCRQGVRTATGETLSELLYRNKIGLESIPKDRLDEMQNSMYLNPTNVPKATDAVGWP